MRKLTIIESAIVGLFIGAIVSTYLAYLSSNGLFVGKILGGASLLPLLAQLHISFDSSLVAPFLAVIAVYTLYGAIIGAMAATGKRTKVVLIIAILVLIIGAYIEQRKGASSLPSAAAHVPQVSSVPSAPRQKAPERYFGTEAVGDLNGDGQDDIAFIASRKDPDRGMLYYIIASLKQEGGHQGTNLVFLGDGVEPKGLLISSGYIDVSYLDASNKKSGTTSDVYAQVSGGILKLVDAASASSSSPTQKP